MSKISEIDSSVYTGVLTATLPDLPDLRFNSNIPDLKVAMDAIQECLELKLPGSDSPLGSAARKESDISSAVANVIDTYNGLKKCPEHVCYFETLEKLADNLGDSVSNIFTTLTSGIKPDVEELKKQIYATADENIAKSNKQLKTANGIKIEYNITDFDQIFKEFGGRDELTEMIEAEFGFKPALLLSSIRMMLASKAVRINRLDLDHDAWFEGISQNGLSDDENVDLLKELLTDPSSAARFVNDQIKLINEPEGYARFYNALIFAVAPLADTFAKVSTIAFNISPVAAETLANNVNKVRNIFALLAYVGLIIEDDLKKNRTLIMDYNLLYEGTIDTYRDKVGSFDMVSKFLKVRYINANREIPPSGIRVDRVINEVKDIENEFNTSEIAETLQAVSIRRNALRTAAIAVFTNYLAETPEGRLPNGVTADKFVASKDLTIRKFAGKIDVNSIESDNVEDVIYNFIIEVWYSNTPVEFAYKLGINEVLTQMSISPELSADACDIIDTSIGATILSDFILKNLMRTK